MKASPRGLLESETPRLRMALLAHATAMTGQVAEGLELVAEGMAAVDGPGPARRAEALQRPLIASFTEGLELRELRHAQAVLAQ